MPKRKNQVCYTKPELPNFLKKIREQIAYKDDRLAELEKRQKLAKNLDENNPSEDYEGEEEKPQVIVLKKGDLTAEEAEAEKRRIEKEENEKPADLSQRIIFKSKSKSSENSKDSLLVSSSSLSSSSSSTSSSTKKIDKEKVKNKKSKAVKSKLSFNDEEDETED